MATLVTIAKLALALLQAFGWVNNLAERRAGAAQSELDAQNAEIKRNQAAADAGNTVTDSLHAIESDPNNRAGKPPASM